MTDTTCVCRFPVFHDDAAEFSAEWHRRHKAHHLAAFPDLDDQRTVDNLDQSIRLAEEASRDRAE